MERFGLLSEHFWLLCTVIWLVGTRLPYRPFGYTGANREKRIELQKIVGLFFGAASAALWILQLTSGLTPNPDPWSWQTPQQWLAMLVILLFWVAIFWWAFLRGGARLVADAYSLKPILVRIFIIGIAIFTITQTVSGYLSPRGMFG